MSVNVNAALSENFRKEQLYDCNFITEHPGDKMLKKK